VFPPKHETGNVLKLLVNNVKVAFIAPNFSTNHFLSINILPI
jgi:hypothetical protein